MDSAVTHPLERAATPRRIHVSVSLLAAALVFAGFWRTYFGPLLEGSLHAVLIIHLHAVVFVAWLALVICQSVLAAIGRTALHVRIGKIGMWYGLCVILFGLLAALNGFATRIHAGRIMAAQRFLWGPLTDLVVFAMFFGAAWAYRRRPEIHKRLIVVATTTLLIAPVGRLPFWLGAPVTVFNFLLFLIVWLSPLFVAMGHDYLSRRIIHPVYVIGVLSLIALRFRNPLKETDTWLSVSGWLAGFYT
jgi:hypothetical protein